jgi:hypothetical protein
MSNTIIEIAATALLIATLICIIPLVMFLVAVKFARSSQNQIESIFQSGDTPRVVAAIIPYLSEAPFPRTRLSAILANAIVTRTERICGHLAILSETDRLLTHETVDDMLSIAREQRQLLDEVNVGSAALPDLIQRWTSLGNRMEADRRFLLRLCDEGSPGTQNLSNGP